VAAPQLERGLTTIASSISASETSIISSRRSRCSKTIHALTRALAVLVTTGGRESALRESFVHAMAGLGAEKGVLIQVRQQRPLDVEILYFTGLGPENEAGSAGVSASPCKRPT
jgi:hypothetical protein